MTLLLQTNPAVTSNSTNEFPPLGQATSGKLPSLPLNIFPESAVYPEKTLPGTTGSTGVKPLGDILAFMYVLSCRQDNCMTYVGPQIANLGFLPEKWLGKPDSRLQQIHEEDIGRFDQAMRHSRSTAETFECQYRLYDSNGKIHWFHDEASVVCDKSGAPLFFSGIMLDLTGKKEMEGELNEYRYYLEQNVERRTEQLEKSMALLESCNAALCDKLALARKELVALRQQPGTLFGAASNDCTGSSCIQF